MALVLVVEDEEQVRVLAGSVLESSGHQILTAETIEQAVALIQAQPVDILFTDIGLKQDEAAGVVHPGLTLAEQALSIRPDIRVLYTTGQGVTDGMKALFVPGSDFLPKPYDLNQLETKVTELTRVPQDGGS
jgi:DNA-binding NtrC family response regulator